ncbi:hypothetical protein A2867_04960 [Candidatus Daviesbacteria bacterium RIFCSPHIGHO2_01_FULL_40_11]|uniref:Uncharacterized protein n=1 Tax=Candidatus Daviesbacteria bacterium RIFCSPHIGHO2_01_FULL_40_11 TaxID=1797762 RepID=A0A1F5JI51_9BACT|nr:MAG: hypothetical protein A2867_04960 [Candidatus Daviesbacteria bacterium RIFCSPHIGHO2_01_FULL_40_11]
MAIERISSEIKDGVKKGQKYAAQTASGAFDGARSIGTSIFGEATFYRTPGGGWAIVVTKPGLRHLIRKGMR